MNDEPRDKRPPKKTAPKAAAPPAPTTGVKGVVIDLEEYRRRKRKP